MRTASSRTSRQAISRFYGEIEILKQQRVVGVAKGEVLGVDQKRAVKRGAVETEVEVADRVELAELPLLLEFLDPRLHLSRL